MAFPHGTRMFSGEAINASTATGPPRVEAPLTGATITLGSDDTVLYVNPAGTIAALTIRLPPTASQQLGKVVNISFSQIVTALTVQDSAGAAVASTSGAVTTGQQYRYVNATLGWARWQ
jgi:predicted amidohydrolase YtcJ